MSNLKTPLDYQLTIAETAKRLGVGVATVRRWVNRGELKAYRYGDRIIRIDPADVVKFRKPVTPLSEVAR